MSKVKLIHVTPDAEKFVAYCARVSNPANQQSEDIEKLIKYCAINNHWSVFEMASMCVEINTSRAISAQILRHRSFSFQEFSQRYAAVGEYPEVPEVRTQDTSNRQSSNPSVDVYLNDWWNKHCKQAYNYAYDTYMRALKQGIAKEVARMVLPMGAPTQLYMHGTLRSWIHYINVRAHPHTQKEHQDVANEIKTLFANELPIIASAVGFAGLLNNPKPTNPTHHGAVGYP